MTKNAFYDKIGAMQKSFIRKSFEILGIFLIFVGIFSFSPKTFALEGAKWGGTDKTTIIYGGKTFTKVSGSDKNKFPENLRSGEIFLEKTNASTSEVNAQIITLSKIEDKIDGKLASVKIAPNGAISQNGETQNLSGEGTATDAERGETSCAIEGGMGWVLCGISNSLAKAADSIYGIVEGFLQVQPLQTTNKSGVYVVWNYMKNIANVLFAIFVIVVVYSQITNIGISNYGIKKMLPKMIIAAILINLSYYICAIAIDLSNITGHQLQNMLVGIRQSVFSNSEITAQKPEWAQVVTALMAGTTWAGYSFAALGGWAGLAWTVGLILIGILYSAFVAFMVLAARQAIITVLIFLSPLAFAASILPNTNKWYDKWKDIFTTMLVMYPLIALIFGGSQLAGMTIIANSNGNFATLILGMAVQVIPLAITPTIMKVSGGLLSKFAGIINNPNKGPVDAAKRFMQEGRDNAVQRRIAKGKNLTSLVNGMSYNRKSRHASNKKIAEQYQQSRFQKRELDRFNEAIDMEPGKRKERALSRSVIHNESKAQEFANNISKDYSLKLSEIKAEALRATLKLDDDGNVVGIKEPDKEFLRKYGKFGVELAQNINEANAKTHAEKNNNIRINSDLASNLRYNEDLLNMSAGVRGSQGKTSSLASAIAASAKETNDEIASLKTLFQEFNLNGNDFKDIYNTDMGKNVKLGDMEFEVTKNLRAAAAEGFMRANSVAEALNAITDASNGGKYNANRAHLVEAFNKEKKEAVQFIGGAYLGNIATKGDNGGESAISHVISKYQKEVSDEKILKADADTLSLLYEPSTFASMSSEAKKSTLLAFAKISQDADKYKKITAAQGHQVHELYNHLKNSGLLSREYTTPGGELYINIDNIKNTPKSI